MGKVYFITYGDKKYRESVARISKEAEQTGVFHEIIGYTDEQLPEPFKTYAARYPRGGGYWLWKPWAVWNTWQQMQEGDVLVYADAGCTLLPHPDWQRYLQRIAHKKALFFIAEGKNRKWCKKEVFDFFTPCIQWWKYARQVQATFFMIRKEGENDVVERWYELARTRPELFTDVLPENRSKECAFFKEHRHDQSVLTACICTSAQLEAFCFLPEKMERKHFGGQAVLASRISAEGVRGTQANASEPRKWKDWIKRMEKSLQCHFTAGLFRLNRLFSRSTTNG
ncbi:hypothetical protein [Phocaeicola faecicola]|jgi:hypothetical protein|uniref:hypothetical protein n=1 Tax=Phocaeicola faecicola TaxID=2739389 RepID=UPI0015B603A1|nr:hypothetical protein [Phocaeicola faecicola]MCI5742872.1 hypothetical protein [Bacteroides sp.]MDD6909325.1 hypothetical protein [Bacteroidaceae bacterium]MDY4872986.1 hypothetical protein [Phocaeicola faecicola]